MPRVGKAKRLRRRARLERKAIRREDYEELADRFREFMATNNCPGYITVDDTGVTITGPLRHYTTGAPSAQVTREQVQQ